MEKENYTIYPHDEEIGDDLTPADKLIYLTIRRYANNKSLECFVSYKTITKDCGAAAVTIKKSVNNLVKNGYLETKRKGKYIYYIFNNKKKFEAFSDDFLNKKDLTFTEKAYLVASRQYMFKDVDKEECRISYSNKELANIINISASSVSRLNASLQEKGYLEDADALVKIFKMRELDKMFVWKLGEHESRLNIVEDDIKEMKKEIEELRKENARLKENKKKTCLEFEM